MVERYLVERLLMLKLCIAEVSTYKEKVVGNVRGEEYVADYGKIMQNLQRALQYEEMLR
jgi:hypothetical protein